MLVVGVYPQFFARSASSPPAAELDVARPRTPSPRLSRADPPRGPIPFDAFVELALYGDGGFFTEGAAPAGPGATS